MRTLIIIGGGIGGLTLAACLQHRGISPILYERAPQLTQVGAAIALWPNATRILRRIDILNALTAIAHVAPAGALRDHHGRVLKTMAAASDAPTIFAHRADLHSVLLAAIPALPLHLNKRCVGIERDGEKVRAAFTDGTNSPWADGLIGADGIHSTVRELTLADGPPRYRGYVAWRGVAAAPNQEIAGETWGNRGRRFGLIPLGHHRIGWWATANVRDPAETVMKAGPAAWKAEVLRLFSEWHVPVARIVEATPVDAVLCNTIDDRVPADHWGDGAVTLLGDAAHPTTPNLGQGACMAIEDAAVLAHAVDAVPQVPAAFRVYEATRRERTAFIVRESLKFGRVGQWENPWACTVRNILMRCASDHSLKKRFEALWGYDAWTVPLMMPR